MVRDVIVVGAGPVGLLMAAELARHGVDVEVLERHQRPTPGTRAIGVHPPVLAALEPSGMTDRLLADAARVSRGEARAAGRTLGVVRFDRLSARFPFVATLPQSATEASFAHVAPSPTRGFTVTAIRPRYDHVVVRGMRGGDAGERRARLVVAASGVAGRHLVYRADALQTTRYPDHYLMTDAAADAASDPSVAVVHLERTGVLESFPLPQGHRRYVAWDPNPADTEPDARAARFQHVLSARAGVRLADTVIPAAFRVRRVIASRLRNGRIFALGDAAHEVSPIGGQGMNLGLLDAVGLAPLLVQWLRTGNAPDLQLQAWERHRVASARRAADLAALNTRVGRPLAPPADAVRRAILRAAVAGPVGAQLARAYAMGYDLEA